MIQKFFRFTAVTFFTVLFVFSAFCADNPAGKIYYTKVNIWYENPEKILSTNYHRGAIIPVGTKVNILKYNRKIVQFNEKDSGVIFTLVYARKHSRIKLAEIFDRCFSEDNIMSEDGVFYKFTKREQENIENGIVVAGMSKDAVLAAYGYPPSHKTPNLSSNVWNYWKSRYVKVLVSFKDDKVLNIEEINEGDSRRPRWYDYAF